MNAEIFNCEYFYYVLLELFDLKKKVQFFGNLEVW